MYVCMYQYRGTNYNLKKIVKKKNNYGRLSFSKNGTKDCEKIQILSLQKSGLLGGSCSIMI